MTEDSHAVLQEAEVLGEAYDMGWCRFEDAPEEATDAAVDHFTESAKYANVVAPSLRALAGFADGGHGTYTEERPVVVVPHENADDLPQSGFLTDADRAFETVHDAWRSGSFDALEGRNRGASESLVSFY